MGRLLIIFGIMLIITGVIFNLLGRFSLPGDFKFQRGNFTFYFPIVTSIVLSIILSLILNFFSRR
ncbi:MAG TPA: DUF2905 domain-containing protein [Verrucomicrobiae bacterium]|nr:DUF2905 domain-containing protein [Verrucomicrobiae bacterium]